MNRPAAATQDGLTARPYHYWAGESGHDYIHGVYRPGELPHYTASSIVMVVNRGGRRTAVDVGATGQLPEMLFNSRRYRRALRRGVNELHVHIAGSGESARAAARDIARAISLDKPAAGGRRELEPGRA